MSKTIRVEDSVYLELEKLRDWKQTFSEVIEDLVFTRAEICKFLDVIEGQIRFREWQRDKIEQLKQHD